MQKKNAKNLGIAMLCAGVALVAFPFFQTSMQGSIGSSAPYSGGGGGTATTFKTMSQNTVAASSSFGSLFSWGSGSISNGNLQKINAANLQIDSVSVFDGGGYPVGGAPTYVAQPYPQPYASPAPNVAPSDAYTAPYYKETGRDAFPAFQENTVKSAAADPVSTFSIDVDTSSYSFIRRMVNEGHLPQSDAVRLEELINYFPYNYPLPEKADEPFRPTIAVYDCPWKEGNKLLHIGIKGYDLEARPKSNLVFLIDTSGSMSAPDKLQLLVTSLKLMLDSLNPDDTVGIVTYAGTADVALESVRAAEKGRIIAVLDSLRSGGSTAGGDGIQKAYDLAARYMLEEGNNRVILATDGDFNVGISSTDQLKDFIERKRDKGIFLSVLGFGQGNYHDNTMQALAQAGNGNAAYIDNLNEARKALVEEAASTLFAIAKDVKIQVEFNPSRVQEYRLIGYETRHLNREDFSNDKIDAGEIGAGHAVTAIYEITPAGAKPLLESLRYGTKEKAPVHGPQLEKSTFTNEYAILKIRYKRPDSDKSQLMTQPVTAADEKTFDELPDDIRFAAAVAGFGQLLRHSKYTDKLSWNDVVRMADNARGKDEFGYRMEFVNLVKLAKSEAATQ